MREQLRLDSLMLPTGERVTAEVAAGRSGRGRSTTPTSRPPTARLRPRGRWPAHRAGFLDGYPYAQVFAPAGDDVIAFEPMTAPTNALVDGGAELPLVAPGESYEASFSITLADGE